MTPELLEKLAAAREKAREKRVSLGLEKKKLKEQNEKINENTIKLNKLRELEIKQQEKEMKEKTSKLKNNLIGERKKVIQQPVQPEPVKNPEPEYEEYSSDSSSSDDSDYGSKKKKILISKKKLKELKKIKKSVRKMVEQEDMRNYIFDNINSQYTPQADNHNFSSQYNQSQPKQSGCQFFGQMM